MACLSTNGNLSKFGEDGGQAMLNTNDGQFSARRPSTSSLNSTGSYSSDGDSEEGDCWEDAVESQQVYTLRESRRMSRISDARARRLARPAQSEQDHASKEGGDDQLAGFQQAPKVSAADHHRQSSVALDSLDIEGLIASYNPMIHPSVKKHILSRQNSILEARQEAASHPSIPSSTLRRLDTSASRTTSLYSQQFASSTSSLHQIPTASKSPVKQVNKLSRKSSTSSFTSIFRKKQPVDQPRPVNKGQWMSGELGNDHEDEMTVRPPPNANANIHRTISGQSERRLSYPEVSGLREQQTRNLESTLPSTADIHIRQVRIPRKAVPTRFTLPSPRVEQSMSVDAPKYDTYSPRSSTSSQSQTSFRWSVDSKSTASSVGTSRTGSSQSHGHRHDKRTSGGRQIDDILEYDPSMAVGVITLDEDEPASFQPGHRRGKESIDSIDSVESNDALSARDFPAPPPLSRKNSTASGVSSIYPSSASMESARTQSMTSQGSFLPTTTSQPPGPVQGSDTSSLRSVRTVASPLSLQVHTSAPLRSIPRSDAAKTTRELGTGVAHLAILNAHVMGRSQSLQG